MESVMQLTFLLAPVPDLATALPFYRDTLGLDEAWREGENTVAFHLPDRKAQIMVVAGGDPAGPMYKVDSVPQFFADHPDINVVMAPRPIPGGSVAGFHDPAGNVAYVFDQVEP
jgi:catechol 2,3-dioxygenase-like lactoylglutathione lyase family enzyme